MHKLAFVMVALALAGKPAFADSTTYDFHVTVPAGPPGPKGDPGPAPDLSNVTVRLNALEAAVAALQAASKPVVTTPPVPVVTTPPPAPVLTANVLRGTVGPGQTWPYVGDSIIACQRAKCTDLYVTVYPGTTPDYYTNDANGTDTNGVHTAKTAPNPDTGRGWYGNVDFNMTIEAVQWNVEGAVKPRFSITDASALYYQKGIFIPSKNFTMRGIDCDGGPGGHAYILTCIRPEPGNVQSIVLTNNEFHNWANGNLGTMSAGGSWLDQCSYYHDNGADSDSGNSHNLYISGVDSVVVDQMLSIRQMFQGHLIKLRSKTATITNSRFVDTDVGRSSYGIDLPEGGVDVVKNVIISRGPKAANGPAIAWNEEIQSAVNPQGIVQSDGRAQSLTLDGVMILSTDDPNGPHLGTLGLWNRANLPVTATNMTWFGPDRTSRQNNGTADVEWLGQATKLPSMPTVDLTPATCH